VCDARTVGLYLRREFEDSANAGPGKGLFFSDKMVRYFLEKMDSSSGLLN
jgi:hypothetical protein